MITKIKKIFHLLKFKLANVFSRFKNGSGAYYINGPDLLPPPLTAEEEIEVLSRLPYDDEARKTLIERNLRLVVYIAKRFENTGIYIEDLISIGTTGLIKAVNTFRPDKNIKLATYASRCIENEILMYIRKNSVRMSDISLDEPLNVDWDGNELLLSDVLCSDDNAVEDLMKREEIEIIHQAVNALDPRERQIIIMRFGLDGNDEMTQKEVADSLGISQSYISRLEKRIIAKLHDELAEKL